MGISKNVYYEDCDEGIKSQIISKFIEKYSDKNIKEIYYHIHQLNTGEYIYYFYYADKYNRINFRNRL